MILPLRGLSGVALVLHKAQRMNPGNQGERYQIGGQIARGGMGAILSARDTGVGRTVAMKVMRADRLSEEGKVRFVREAQILGQLEHPNIVPMHELGTDEQGQPYYTMKFVKGRTLSAVLAAIKGGEAETIAEYPLSQLLTVFQKVCDAVAYAHAKGIVHRDLKPENIMLGHFGEVLVMDWGLAKVLGSTGDPPVPSGASPDGSGGEQGFQEQEQLPGNEALTLDGAVMGTPQFMAPEQAEGRIGDIDERTDIFALGGILYSLLTLRPPTSGTSVREILDNIRSGYIPPPIFFNKAGGVKPDGQVAEQFPLAHCPGGKIPEALSAVAMKAMAVEPAERYATVPELQAEIAAFQGGFATGAESAGRVRQIWLWYLRHKVTATLVFSTTMIILCLTAGFTWKVTKTLSELRGTAPTFYREAQALVEEQKLTNALERIGYAIQLRPDEPDYHALKGNILQSMLQLSEASAAYDQALKLKPDHSSAQKNRQLCNDLIKRVGQTKEWSFESMEQLRTNLLAQGRSTEAIAIGQRLGQSVEDDFERWKGIWSKTGWNGTLTKNPDNTLSLIVNDPAVADLRSIKGMPLSSLVLARSSVTNLTALAGGRLKYLEWYQGTAIADLTPLEGLPLQFLGLTSCTNITDLSPLKGMLLEGLYLNGCINLEDLRPIRGLPIKRLTLGQTKVNDINPLKGMPLRELSITHRPDLSDISALEGMPLEDLGLHYCSKVSDLRALKGMKLVALDISLTQVADISVLGGMPIARLTINDTKISDISPLEGMPLTTLRMGGLKVNSLAPLKDAPLTILHIDNTAITNLNPLVGKRLTHFDANGTKVADVNPLAGMPLTVLSLGNTLVTNLAPLRGMPLTALYVNRTKIKDLSPLKGMPLQTLVLDDSLVSDLSPIADCPIAGLYMRNGPITNLAAISGLPLRELRLDGCKLLKDLTPVAACQQLERISIPNQIRDLDALRQLPNLKFIGYLANEDFGQLPPAADFWRAYDARNQGKKK
ncbi:MAG: protein kinase [Verrucomicrobiota bacterium]